MLELLPQKKKTEKPDFSDFYNEWYQKTVQYVYRKIDNHHDAEDLVEEAFLYCYSHYDSYDPSKSAISTWLYLVVNSRIKNYYRDNKTNVDLDAVVDFIPDDQNDMDAGIYTEQLIAQVDRAIKTLPERQQKIVRMRYFENKTSEEIADILGISRGNARVLLSRAIASLEKQCAEFVKGDY